MSLIKVGLQGPELKIYGLYCKILLEGGLYLSIISSKIKLLYSQGFKIYFPQLFYNVADSFH